MTWRESSESKAGPNAPAGNITARRKVENSPSFRSDGEARTAGAWLAALLVRPSTSRSLVPHLPQRDKVPPSPSTERGFLPLADERPSSKSECDAPAKDDVVEKEASRRDARARRDKGGLVSLRAASLPFAPHPLCFSAPHNTQGHRLQFTLRSRFGCCLTKQVRAPGARCVPALGCSLDVPPACQLASSSHRASRATQQSKSTRVHALLLYLSLRPPSDASTSLLRHLARPIESPGRVSLRSGRLEQPYMDELLSRCLGERDVAARGACEQEQGGNERSGSGDDGQDDQVLSNKKNQVSIVGQSCDLERVNREGGGCAAGSLRVGGKRAIGGAEVLVSSDANRTAVSVLLCF